MDIIKKSLKPLLFYGGLPRVKRTWRRLSRRHKIFILMYHKVDYDDTPFFGEAVKPDVFERQVIFLKKYYQIVNLNDLKKMGFNQNQQKDIAVLTFDDGYRNNYDYAFPVLKKYNVPATIFLTTDYINTKNLLWYDRLAWILNKAVSIPDKAALIKYDLSPELCAKINDFFTSGSSLRHNMLNYVAASLKTYPTERRDKILSRLSKACKVNTEPENSERAMLSWDEVNEMSRHNISFGSHTKTHPVLSAILLSESKNEIVESKRVLEEKLQQSVTTFAYPYGKKEDFNGNITKILSDEGFEYACSTITGAEEYPLKAPLTLKRKGVALSPYLFY